MSGKEKAVLGVLLTSVAIQMWIKISLLHAFVGKLKEILPPCVPQPPFIPA
jgi:hypothetical protein